MYIPTSIIVHATHNAIFYCIFIKLFESPTSFKDETTTADNKQMTYENFSRNFGHNFCEMIIKKSFKNCFFLVKINYRPVFSGSVV